MGLLVVARTAVAQQSEPPSVPAASFGRFGNPKEEPAPPERTGAPAPPPMTPRLEPPRFGDPGQFAVLAGSRIGVGYTSFADSSTSFGVTLQPSLEYFIVRNVSIGGQVNASHSSNRSASTGGSSVEDDSNEFGVAVHLGANVWLGRWFSLYPMLSVGFRWAEQKTRFSDTDQVDSTGLGPVIGGQVPLLYHPVEHFFVGIGPTVFHDFTHTKTDGTSDGKELTQVGANFVLGGYFDLRGHAEDEEEPWTKNDRPPSERPKFADAGVVVVTEDNGFTYTSSYGTVPATSWSISAGFDWFFTKSHSLGAATSYSHYAAREFPNYSSDSVGFSVRYGYSVSLSSWLSIYPRVSLGYEIDSGAPPGSAKALAATLYAPLLFQAARHFVMGFGPSVSQDILRTESGDSQNRRTFFGASSMIAGWL